MLLEVTYTPFANGKKGSTHLCADEFTINFILGYQHTGTSACIPSYNTIKYTPHNDTPFDNSLDGVFPVGLVGHFAPPIKHGHAQRPTAPCVAKAGDTLGDLLEDRGIPRRNWTTGGG